MSRDNVRIEPAGAPRFAGYFYQNRSYVPAGAIDSISSRGLRTGRDPATSDYGSSSFLQSSVIWRICVV